MGKLNVATGEDVLSLKYLSDSTGKDMDMSTINSQPVLFKISGSDTTIIPFSDVGDSVFISIHSYRRVAGACAFITVKNGEKCFTVCSTSNLSRTLPPNTSIRAYYNFERCTYSTHDTGYIEIYWTGKHLYANYYMTHNPSGNIKQVATQSTIRVKE